VLLPGLDGYSQILTVIQGSNKAELERRENELKEKALRNKVIRTRKRSSS
jgi:serine/arginine repetitive matrix protein 1